MLRRLEKHLKLTLARHKWSELRHDKSALLVRGRSDIPVGSESKQELVVPNASVGVVRFFDFDELRSFPKEEWRERVMEVLRQIENL